MGKTYLYYLLMTLAGLIGFAKIALYANFLTPEELGAYSLCLLLSTYGIYACSLGLYEGALGVFPTWYGQGQGSTVKDTRNQILGFLCFSTIALNTLAVITLFAKPEFILWGFSILLVTIFSCSSTFFLVLLADIRSRLMTLKFGAFMLARAILSVFSGSLLVQNYGYQGILLSEIIITLVLTMILAIKGIDNFGFSLPDFPSLKPIFRVGFPLMLNGAVTNTAANMDRFFVVAALGTNVFGQYSFAMILASGGAMVQAILYQQIGPEVLHSIGQGLSPKQVLSRLNRFTFCLFAISAVCAYPLLFAARKGVSQFFPEYAQAISILPLVYMGSTFTAISLYENFTVALQKTEYILALNACIILGVALASYIVMQQNASILIFSGIYAVSRFLYFMSTFMMAHWAVEQIPSAKG